MPYKSKQKKREYQREWARRKRRGLPTRTTTLLTDEERKKRSNEASKRIYNNKKRMIKEVFGVECFFCGNTKVGIMHKKDGEPHKLLNEMGYKQLKDTLENHTDEYVRVCGICHKAIHWCMKHLNMTWEDIIEQADVS